jgi:hypothetical protein
MGTAQARFTEMVRGGATGSDVSRVTRSDVSHVTRSDVSHVTGNDITGSDIIGTRSDCACTTGSRAFVLLTLLVVQ